MEKILKKIDAPEFNFSAFPYFTFRKAFLLEGFREV